MYIIQERNHVQKSGTERRSVGALLGEGRHFFKGAPMPKCAISKMQHGTGATLMREREREISLFTDT